MSGGTTSQTSNANGNVAFNPTSIGGGNIMVGGNVGQAGVQQSTNGQATGASVGLDFSMSMPGMDGMPGMGGAKLQNLKSLYFNNNMQNVQLQNLGFLGDMTKILDSTAQATGAVWEAVDEKDYEKNGKKVIDGISVGAKAAGGIEDQFNLGANTGIDQGMSSLGWDASNTGSTTVGLKASEGTFSDADCANWQKYDETFWYCDATGMYYNEQYDLKFNPSTQMYIDYDGNTYSVEETKAYFGYLQLQNLAFLKDLTEVLGAGAQVTGAIWSAVDEKDYNKNGKGVIDGITIGSKAASGFADDLGYLTGIDSTAEAWGYTDDTPTTGGQQQGQQQVAANSYTDNYGNVWQRYDATWWWCDATQQYYNEQYQLNFNPTTWKYFDDYGNEWSVEETDAYFAGY